MSNKKTVAGLLLIMANVISSQTVPSSCFWCVSQSKKWDSINKVCDKTYSNKIVTTA